MEGQTYSVGVFSLRTSTADHQRETNRCIVFDHELRHIFMIMVHTRSCRPFHLILSGHQMIMVVGLGGVVSVVSSVGDISVSSFQIAFVFG